MFLLQPRFWLRLLSSGIAVALIAFGVAAMAGGGWGPCGPSSGWAFNAVLIGLLSIAMAAASVAGAVVSMLLVVPLRAMRRQRCR